MMLESKRVLLTGASRGIGAAIARAFAQQGARLVVTARSHDVESVALELRQSTGADVRSYLADITDEIQVKALVTFARHELGGLDVLVNNAGLLLPGRIGMIRPNDVQRMYATNVAATISLTQYAARMMRPGSSIVNMASIAGTNGMEEMAAYAATKAAIVGFTASAAKELGAVGIRVNAIAPGFIETEMVSFIVGERRTANISKVRMGRIGQPDDVANCALFLASDLSTYVTGQTIRVDGGFIV